MKQRGGIRSEDHKVRIGDTNHQRFVNSFDHELLQRMRALRAAGRLLSEIAAETEKSVMTVSRWLRHGTSVRQNVPTEGPRAPAGDPYESSQGYVLLTIDGRTVYEHQHIAEKALGRRGATKWCTTSTA
jgi:hypothetical protein